MLHALSTTIANDVDRPTLLPDSILTARTQQDATRVEMLECDSRWRRAAEARVASLAKPPGSLGTLEAWYVTLCAVQETLEPAAGPACAIVFVGDHGLMKDSPLSPYPQSATQTMFKALAGGVSCAAVLTRSVGASLVVVDVGIDGDVSNVPAANGVEVIHAKVARGTTAFPSPAMTSHVHYTCDDGDDHSHSHSHEHKCDGHGPCLDAALLVGRDRVAAAASGGARIICIGEVGVGNDVAAACLLALLTGSDAKTCCRAGHQIDTVQTIVDAVRAGSGMCPGIEWPGGLARESLRCVGSLEMAAMVGAFVVAPSHGVVMRSAASSAGSVIAGSTRRSEVPGRTLQWCTRIPSRSRTSDTSPSTPTSTTCSVAPTDRARTAAHETPAASERNMACVADAGYGLSAASAFLHPWSAQNTNASVETVGRKVSCATHNVMYHSSSVPSAPGGFASDATRVSASLLHSSGGLGLSTISSFL